MGKYENKNATAVLENVEKMLEDMETRYVTSYRIRDVYEELSIFDWWPERLTATKLKDMRKFLRTAIKRGYTGYVCFKVGATGCANGMWAHKEESEDGFSPDGEFLYKSFTPEYNYWSVKAADGEIYPKTEVVEEKRGDVTYMSRVGYDRVKTIKQLDALLEEVA